MTISRKGFIGGAAAFAALRPWRAFAAEAGTEPNLRFGVVSDLHVRGKDGKFGTEAAAKAFAFFRDRGVDGVAIAGDIADDGLVSQLQCVADAWNEAFPGGKGLGGKPVEKLFVYGNHDLEGLIYNKSLKPAPGDVIVNDRAAAWERVFGEPYEPIWKKTVKGYSFIGAQWGNWDGVKGLEPYFRDHAAELRGEKPFFFIQHPHPKDTCHGPWAWGHDNGCSTKVLSEFPNAVAFSGHSHHPLTDERSIWQGSFTSIGTGSLRYVGSVFGRENAGPSSNDGFKQMPGLNSMEGKNGMLVSVYDDRIEIERLDFVNGGKLGADWVFPLPVAGAKPYDFKTRAAAAKAPRFPAGAKVTVSGPADGKDRKGRPARQLTVEFPSAMIGEGLSRARDYEVVAETEEYDIRRVAKAKRVYGPGYFKTPGCEGKTVKCVFSLDEIGVCKGPCFAPVVRFYVRAAESFGKESEPLVSEPVKL